MLPEDRPSPVKLMVNAEARPEDRANVPLDEHAVKAWAPRESKDQQTDQHEAELSSAVSSNPFLDAIQLPSFEQVVNDSKLYAQASRILHRETNPMNARALVQAHGPRWIWLNPPPLPLTTPEIDGVFELPFQRVPHPSYGDARIPAYEMIRFSVNIMRVASVGAVFAQLPSTRAA